MNFNGTLPPDDSHNRSLVKHLHPPNWPLVKPSGRYNLVVIGGGPAGLVTALGAAGLGARVALVERALLGGDCLNMGCVPSKAVIRAGHVAQAARDSEAYGVTTGPVEVDFAKVMQRMRKIRSDIAHHDSAERLKEAGIDVFLGHASFSSGCTVRVNETELSFSRAVIATGARAAVPPIPGLDQTPFLTNESLFELTELPKRFIVIGAGPIGLEMAQTFARLGSHTTVIDMADRVLPRDDPDAAALVQARLTLDGLNLKLGAKVLSFAHVNGEVQVTIDQGQGPTIVAGDKVLLAVGRSPNLDGLKLDQAGVDSTRRGVVVNDFLQSSNPKIYAAGDICSPYQFTHTADAQARIVIQNALFFGRKRMSQLTIPWATYVTPEVAHVGLTHTDAEGRDDVLTFTVPLSDVDRAICDGRTEGFAKVYANAKGQILGATIVAESAGDLLAEVTLAMTHKLTLGHIASTIHPYPTQSEVIAKVAGAYNRTRLTPTVAGLLKRLLAWRR